MSTNDNAARVNERRDEDAIPAGFQDCIDVDALAIGYAEGDPASTQSLAEHLLDVPARRWRELLDWLAEYGDRLRGDA